MACSGCGMSATIDRLDLAVYPDSTPCFSCPVCGALIEPEPEQTD